jgi:hypothetical protein
MSGDVLNFFGSMIGAAITVWGSFAVITHNAKKRVVRDKANLLSFLAIMEERLKFASSDELLANFLADRDVPGLINRCALVVEMRDLLNSQAVAEAAEGFQQFYALHRLKRQLSVWSHKFEPYADIPYTDFYKLAPPNEFERVVEQLVVPVNIIRASVHLFVSIITGRNMVLEEIAQQNGGEIGKWNPDAPYIPD